MTDSISARSEAPESLVARVVDDFLERQKLGERPDIDEFVADHPEHAQVLREVLAALEIAGLSSPDGSPLSNHNSLADPPLVGTIGDFRIIREVGRGGMGVVYEARQISLGRRVALKVLPFAATMDPKHLQRFHNEARAAASLEHEHIVPVYAVGCDRAVHFYAMKFIDGMTLAQVIAEISSQEPTRPPNQQEKTQSGVRSSLGDFVVDSSPTADLPPPLPDTTAPRAAASTLSGPRDKSFYRQVADLGIQAGDALEHAHSMGVVHRDIKPGNLMIESLSPLPASGRGQGEGFRLWVTDFGLARTAADSGMTRSGDLIGTLRYMSPEQALARHGLVDHRTDIYALGATLYELLTGRPAVFGDDKNEILRQIAFEDPAPPHKLDRAIPIDLETIVLKSMEKNPADRYATAQLLANDLRLFLDDKPIVARRPTLIQRARKWSRRHPSVMASAGVALVLAVMGLVASNLLIARERDAKVLALGEKQQALDEAKTELKRREDVLSFVEQKILAAARPKGQLGGLGSNATVREALVAAIPYVESSFKDEPLIEARLRRTLGLSFHYLGDDEIAVRQFLAALALYTQHCGAEHPDTLACVNNLANSYAALDRNEDALKLHEAALGARQALLGPDHGDVADSMNNLAIVCDKLGRFEEALRLRQDVLKFRLGRLGSDHPDTSAARNNLAISYSTLGRHAEALELRRETLRLQKEKLPPGHPYVLAAMCNLAESLAVAGRYDDALHLYDKTLTLAKRELDENHPGRLLVMNNLAWLLATAEDVKFRDPARAVELAAQAAHASPKTPEFSSTLGTAYYRAGDWKQAIPNLEKAIQLRGPDDCRNANESFFLAMAHWRLGNKPEARKYFDQATAWMDKSKSRSDELRRFRSEAKVLLEITTEVNQADQQKPR